MKRTALSPTCSTIVAAMLLAGCVTSSTKEAPTEKAVRQESTTAKSTGKSKRLRSDKGTPVWVVDNFEKSNTWAVQSWAGKAETQIITSSGNKALEIKYDIGSDKDKCAVCKFFGADISSRKSLTLDVENGNDQSIGVAIALVAGKTGYREAPPLEIGAGKKTTLKFSLKKSYYKEASDNFKEHKATPGDLSELSQIYVLIYTQGKGSLILDNVKLLN